MVPPEPCAVPDQPYLYRMAYRLERDESVIRGLKRVVRDEMKSAGTSLSGAGKTNRDEAIHGTRKSIKKVRAILRLVSAELGGAHELENARLRDVARRLSEFRDAFVIVETFDELKKKYKDEAGDRLKSVRVALAKRRNEGSKAEDVATVLAEAAGALRKATKRVRAWPLQTDGFAAIGPGLEATYRAGRVALARVRKHPRPENFHELRKRVKDHWYHLRLLEDLWTSMMSASEKNLKDLETWLGNDHNLVVLRARIVAEPAFYGKQKDIDLALDLIDRHQEELREQSLSLAERIFAEKPSEFTRRMKHLWDTWRHEPKPREGPPAAA
jgi:CHAD domain-containing protein